MGAMTENTFDMTKAIQLGIRTKVAELLPSVIKEAQENINKALNNSIDQIALEVLQFYTVERRGQELAIIVKKAAT